MIGSLGLVDMKSIDTLSLNIRRGVGAHGMLQFITTRVYHRFVVGNQGSYLVAVRIVQIARLYGLPIVCLQASVNMAEAMVLPTSVEIPVTNIRCIILGV